MTDPTDAEVEAAAKAMAEQDALGATADGPGISRQSWKAYEPMARAALTAAAQVRGRQTQAEIDQLYATSTHISRDTPLMPIYSATEDTEDYGESVLGYRPGDKS
jgi:hypothetical protein